MKNLTINKLITGMQLGGGAVVAQVEQDSMPMIVTVILWLIGEGVKYTRNYYKEKRNNRRNGMY